MPPPVAAAFMWLGSRFLAKVGTVGLVRGFKRFEKNYGRQKAVGLGRKVLWGVTGVGGVIVVSNTDTLPQEFGGRKRILLVDTNTAKSIGDLGSSAIKNAPKVDNMRSAEVGQPLSERTVEFKQCAFIVNEVIMAYNNTVAKEVGLPQFCMGELYVIRHPTPNACTFPNGDIHVNTGLLQLAHHVARQDSKGFLGAHDMLAFVLGHEIGHNVLQHMKERISTASLVSAIKMILCATISMVLPPGADGVVEGLLFFGLDDKVEGLLVNLPYSRLHEMEADHLGMLIAAAACYDSAEGSSAFFNAMKELEKGRGLLGDVGRGKAEATKTKITTTKTTTEAEKIGADAKGVLRKEEKEEKEESPVSASYYSTHPPSDTRQKATGALAARAQTSFGSAACTQKRKDFKVAARKLTGWRDWHPFSTNRGW